MAAFFADVAQVTAAIFWFSIVIVKLGQPVFFTVKTHGLWPHKKRGSENAACGHSRLFSMPDKVSIHFFSWIFKKWILSFKPIGGFLRARTH